MDFVGKRGQERDVQVCQKVAVETVVGKYVPQRGIHRIHLVLKINTSLKYSQCVTVHMKTLHKSSKLFFKIKWTLHHLFYLLLLQI